MMPEAPRGFVIREECEKATWQNRSRLDLCWAGGWTGFACGIPLELTPTF
jgi:hypothetical protein